MKKCYKVHKWGSSEDDIKYHEMIRESDKTIWFYVEIGKRKEERRERKKTSWYQWFNSYEEAKSVIDSRIEEAKKSDDKKRLNDAAPLLLEALEGLIGCHAMHENYDVKIYATKDQMAKAKAAIAAAKGE